MHMHLLMRSMPDITTGGSFPETLRTDSFEVLEAELRSGSSAKLPERCQSRLALPVGARSKWGLNRTDSRMSKAELKDHRKRMGEIAKTEFSGPMIVKLRQ